MRILNQFLTIGGLVDKYETSYLVLTTLFFLPSSKPERCHQVLGVGGFAPAAKEVEAGIEPQQSPRGPGKSEAGSPQHRLQALYMVLKA